MSAGPTTDVAGRPSGVHRSRPGVPDHVRRRRARIVWAVILLLAVTVGAVGWWLGSGRWTTVPSLVGKPESTALGLIDEAGLDPNCCLRQFSESVPSGVVIGAKPAHGEAIRGSKVQLVVSKGPERFSVAADLVGKPKDDVLTALKAMPIQVTVKDTYDNSVAAGSVSGFDPAAGTPLPRNATVTVLVSKGHQPVKVPNVVGSTPDAATAALQQLGFKVTRGPDGRSAAVQTGQVMSATPGPDAGAQPYGSTVTIVVSAGVPQVTVPDVTGKSKDQAVQILQQAGLKVDVQTFIKGNKVRNQSPDKGTVVDQGTTVTILVTF